MGRALSAAGPRVGVLALQGDVREHVRTLESLGAVVSLVRRPAELSDIDGLVLPGGESSVIDKLARAFGLQASVREAIAGGLPVYGTCAGMILLADRLEGGIAGQETFGGLDVTVARNAFGSQAESFEAELAVEGFVPSVSAAFIRAPVATQWGSAVRVLASLPGGRAVAVEQGRILATAFHPEVSGERRFHERFLGRVREARASSR